MTQHGATPGTVPGPGDSPAYFAAVMAVFGGGSESPQHVVLTRFVGIRVAFGPLKGFFALRVVALGDPNRGYQTPRPNFGLRYA